MKVHIIHLDSHDDHVSARDKLGWAKAPRVLVVWPNYGSVLTRKLDLILLQRFASQHSLQIGLVTSDPDVIDNAKTLAIPSFESLDRVSEIGWRRRARGRPKRVRQRSPRASDRQAIQRPSSPPTSRPSQSKILLSSIVGITLLSLTAMMALIIPTAEFSIKPPTERLEVEFTLRLDPEIDTLDKSGLIPAQILTTQVSDSLRIPTTGQVAVPATPSSGSVVFTNLTSDPVEIPAGTGLRATEYENLRFITLASVSLDGETGAQVEADIEATFSGPTGNIPAYAIDAVEGTLGLRLAVENPYPLSGGENDVRAAAATEDFSTLEASLTELLKEQALAQLQAMLENDQVLLAHTLQSDRPRERIFDRQIGEQADTLALALGFEVSVYAYRSDDAESVVVSALASNLPAGFELAPGTRAYEVNHESARVRGGRVELTGNAWQEIHKPVDKALLRDLLRGQDPSVAEALVANAIELTEKPTLRLFPAWFPRIPYLPTQITIHYTWENDT